MPVAIRPAVLDDVPAILLIDRQSATSAHWAPEHYATRVETGIVLAAEQVGQICGFLCVHPVAGEWELENVVVEAGFLRRGIADQLLQNLIERARNEAASAILLEVRASNQPALRLYEKHGFRLAGSRRRYYNDPQEDALLYTLSLGR